MEQQIVSALSGVLGGAIGGLITIWAMFRIQRSTNVSLEYDEIRKKRVEIIYQLLGSRYVLMEGYPATESDVKSFNTAMSLFSIYFAKDPEVMSAYDRLLNSKSDDNIVQMLKVAAKTASLELLDTHIKRVMTVAPKNASLLIPRASQ
jgi:hypothetical protein